MARARAAAAALVLTLLAGCSGGDDDTAQPDESTTTVPAAATCPAVPLPPAPTDSTTVGGDYDGDGRPDRLLTYRVAAGDPWRVRVEPAAGGASEMELPATAQGVRALGGAQLDPSRSETAFAVVGTNPSGVDLGLFVHRSCRLERVQVGGSPSAFPVGSGPASRSGLACQPPGLVAYSATSTDGSTFRATTVAYLLLGTLLDEINRSTSSIAVADPSIARYGAFSCGSLRL